MLANFLVYEDNLELFTHFSLLVFYYFSKVRPFVSGAHLNALVLFEDKHKGWITLLNTFFRKDKSFNGSLYNNCDIAKDCFLIKYDVYSDFYSKTIIEVPGIIIYSQFLSNAIVMPKECLKTLQCCIRPQNLSTIIIL